MHRASCVSLIVILGACGGASTPPPHTGPSPDCDRARVEASRAWDALATRADAESAGSTDEPLAAERALGLLEDHLAQLSRAPREVEGEEAMALSNAMMDGIDEVSAQLPQPMRDRAEDAAEALLTDRGTDGSIRAARGAIALLEELVDQVRPGFGARRAERGTTAELARRARQAADAYALDAASGDRNADRAESAPLPASAAELDEARRAAAEASRDARSACGIDRGVAVPSL